jgi:hypothetical protein
MSNATHNAAKKLAIVLNRVSKKTKGLSDQALNAAAASSMSLGQNFGLSYPTEYVRRRVSLVLTELEDLERIAAEHEDERRSALAKLIGAFRDSSLTNPAAARKTLDAHLRAYCIARGSGTEWKRPSGVMRRVG